jgi:hypothetical protein
LEKRSQGKDQEFENAHGILPIDAAFLDGLRTLPAHKVLDKVLSHPDCTRLIRTMSSEDFFFLVKQVGADGSLDLLKMASVDHWQYILDVESWQKDRLDLDQSAQWIERLLSADPERFTRWLFSDGQGLAYYYLYRSVVVEAKTEDEEIFEAGPEFFTIDEFFYIRPLHEDQRETIEALIRAMAREDTLKYQAVLTGLTGVLPAELEEDMYRMRNVRLAEHGFLPQEEAVMVYAPLKPENLRTKKEGEGVWPGAAPEDAAAVPRWPLQTLQGPNLLMKTISRFSDDKLLDRIRLEFAGLCNQILAAEGIGALDKDVLQEIQVQAAGYLNLILRERCGEDLEIAENLLRMNPLLFLFRAGFGLALNLKWKAERWMKESWFSEMGLEPSFWGTSWGGTLAGLLKKRPLFYCGDESESGFRHFSSQRELSSAENTLGFLNVLDRLMANLTQQYPLELPDPGSFQLTFHQLLFTLWARRLLELRPGFTALSISVAKRFLSLLREGESAPPYRMFGFEERFLKAFGHPGPEAQGSAKDLNEALIQTWRHFSQEMELVPVDALQAKYSKYILITTG